MKVFINEDYERQVLSCLISNNDLINNLILRENDFGIKKHRDIIKAIFKLNKEDKQVDTITIAKETKLTLSEASDIHLACPSDQIFDSLQRAVKELSEKRRFRDMANRINVALDKDKEIEKIEKILYSFDDVEKDEDKGVLSNVMMEEVLNRIDANCKRGGGITGMETGLRRLDTILNGIEKSRYIIIAARTSVGKTAFAMELARRISKKHMSAYFSVEMPNGDLGERLLASESQTKLKNIKNGKLKEATQDKLAECSNFLSTNKLIVNDDEEMTVEKLVKLTKKYKKIYNIEAIFVDYITILGTEQKFSSKVDQVEYISKQLRKLSKTLNIAVITLAQLNRNVDHRNSNEPILSDIKDCGCIEQDANTVLLLYNSEDEMGRDYFQSILKVKIAKNRGGEVPRDAINMSYYKDTQRIEEC